MSTTALLLAQNHDVSPAHLLVVGLLVVAAAGGWLIYRLVRRRDDTSVTGPVRGGSDRTDAAPGGDRAEG
jgi:hypothetical protein